jgi:hypothetical protein
MRASKAWPQHELLLAESGDLACDHAQLQLDQVQPARRRVLVLPEYGPRHW